jgi:hypothetical protein
VTSFALLLTAALGLVLFEAVTWGAMTRRLWHELIRLFLLADLAAMLLVRWVYPPRFVLTGECHQRGVCCQHILAAPPRWLRDSFLRQPFLWYHRVMHNFREIGHGPEGIIVLSCGHLAPEGRCRIYRFRPLLCRNYPELPFFDAPRLLPGCGFTAVPRVVAAMQNRPGLRVVNPYVAVHHPNPDEAGESVPEHFELVDDSPPPGGV